MAKIKKHTIAILADRLTRARVQTIVSEYAKGQIAEGFIRNIAPDNVFSSCIATLSPIHE